MANTSFQQFPETFTVKVGDAIKPLLDAAAIFDEKNSLVCNVLTRVSIRAFEGDDFIRRDIHLILNRV